MDKQIHDASTGFADIEPLEVVDGASNFHGYLTAFLLVFGVVFAILFIRHFLKLLKPKHSESPEFPFRTCRESLKSNEEAFREGSIGARDYSEKISISLRNLLASITKYPAQDRTLKEISNDFPSLLKQRFNLLNTEALDETNEKLLQVLSETLKITFSDKKASGERHAHSIENLTLSVVDRLESHLNEQAKKEALAEKQGAVNR